MKLMLFIVIIYLGMVKLYSNDRPLIVVAKDGTGDYKTISEAINSLPMYNYERTVIYIKNGIYNEKIRIEQDNLTLRGENKDSTIIKYNQLRTAWIAKPDYIGPAVINIHADDFILENLTVENTQPEIGPHAFAIYGTGTRTIILNCNVYSKGGDTVSLWNYKTGMYYHADCSFRGAVDFVCPRGWCFIRNSKFFEEAKTASLWHAGGYNINQKFVLENCSFDGVKGFYLGRHHYEAQFYLLDCTFSENLADKPIYLVINKDPKANRPFNWGERDYFLNCSRTGGNYSWFQNNLSTSNASLSPAEITSSWTFNGKWDPESDTGPVITKYIIHRDTVLFFFNEHLTVIGTPQLRTKSGKLLQYNNGGGSNTLNFISSSIITGEELRHLSKPYGGSVFGTTASVKERSAIFHIK